MKDFGKMKRAIRRATDADLKKFSDTFGHWVKVSNEELNKKAKKLRMTDDAKDRAAVGIQVFRERTVKLIEREMKRRGIA